MSTGRPRIVLVGGGASSGKSDFALALARQLGQRRLFLATAQAGDAEMGERIARHRQTRGDDFHTIEEPSAIAEVIRDATAYDVVVCDCLTLWLSNFLMAGQTPDVVRMRVDELADLLQARHRHVVLVTNEVGLGLVPESSLGRTFRDLAGATHQRLAAVADEVYFAVLGTMLRLKPTLALVTREGVGP